jgi:hypothetical protein
MKYPGDVPVDEPVAPRKMMRKPMPKKPMMPVAPKPRGPGMAPDESVMPSPPMGGALGMKKGGSVGSASKRADGCATKGKTKGRMI